MFHWHKFYKDNLLQIYANGTPLSNRIGVSTQKNKGAQTSGPLIFYSQSKLSDFRDLDFEIFKNHICSGKPKQFYKRICESCANDWELDKNDKPKTHCWSCGSSYCKDKDCFKQRYLVVNDYFMIFFNAYPSWTTERGNRWIHETFGFKRQSLPTRKELTLMRVKIFKFLKAVKEELEVRIKGIGVRDLAYDIEKVGEEFYIHFHFARRPTEFIKKSDLNRIGKKFGLKYVYNSHRESFWLADYFAKRHAGQFGHKKDNSDFMFADIMDSETYFKLFHNSRKSFYYGFTQREVRFLKARYKEIRKSVAFALSSKTLPTTKPTICKNCGCKTFKLVPCEPIYLKMKKPPPEPLKITIEIIKIPTHRY